MSKTVLFFCCSGQTTNPNFNSFKNLIHSNPQTPADLHEIWVKQIRRRFLFPQFALCFSLWQLPVSRLPVQASALLWFLSAGRKSCHLRTFFTSFAKRAQLHSPGPSLNFRALAGPQLSRRMKINEHVKYIWLHMMKDENQWTCEVHLVAQQHSKRMHDTTLCIDLCLKEVERVREEVETLGLSDSPICSTQQGLYHLYCNHFWPFLTTLGHVAFCTFDEHFRQSVHCFVSFVA